MLLICHTCDAERAALPPARRARPPALHYGGIGTERLEREVQGGVPEPRLAADGLRHDAQARQPRGRCWRRSRPARCRSCWARR